MIRLFLIRLAGSGDIANSGIWYAEEIGGSKTIRLNGLTVADRAGNPFSFTKSSIQDFAGLVYATAPASTEVKIGTDPNRFNRKGIELAERELAFDLGGEQVCVASDIEVACWNVGVSESIQRLSLNGVAQVSVGAAASACALQKSGHVQCWDAEGSVQMVMKNSTQVSVVEDRGCALKVSGEIWCWSGGVITPVRAEAKFTQVSAGPAESCAVSVEGEVWCWNAGSLRQVASGATQVAVGSGQSCALLAGGTVTCWNSEEQMDVGLLTVVKIDVEGSFACGIFEQGGASCWKMGQAPVAISETYLTDLAVGAQGICTLSATQEFNCQRR